MVREQDRIEDLKKGLLCVNPEVDFQLHYIPTSALESNATGLFFFISQKQILVVVMVVYLGIPDFISYFLNPAPTGSCIFQCINQKPHIQYRFFANVGVFYLLLFSTRNVTEVLSKVLRPSVGAISPTAFHDVLFMAFSLLDHLLLIPCCSPYQKKQQADDYKIVILMLPHCLQCLIIAHCFSDTGKIPAPIKIESLLAQLSSLIMHTFLSLSLFPAIASFQSFQHSLAPPTQT